ncbi:membrane hypothetical protein [Mesorhizobium plurifarium]|uniref:Uncharacterized protein n=1 Tax=Mesorhizobium plurifarium TaxID=69974 RepID=A0A090GBZ4_MESPL|nr:membrane hypothetical protein [Mesorhizobium plurifarium]
MVGRCGVAAGLGSRLFRRFRFGLGDCFGIFSPGIGGFGAGIFASGNLGSGVVGLYGFSLAFAAFRGSRDFSIVLVLAAVAVLAAATPVAPSAAIARLLFFAGLGLLVVFVLGFLRFGAQQGLTVGDRDLIVVGVNFTEGEKTVTVAAILDKGCLEGRFDAGYAGEVDVSFELLLVLGFKVEFFDAVTANDDNACFLRVGGVYQHLVGHYFVSCRQPTAAAGVAMPAAAHLYFHACRIIECPLAAASARWRCRPQPLWRGSMRTFP